MLKFSEIGKIVNTLENNKAPGKDGKSIVQLTYIVNASATLAQPQPAEMCCGRAHSKTEQEHEAHRQLSTHLAAVGDLQVGKESHPCQIRHCSGGMNLIWMMSTSLNQQGPEHGTAGR